MCRTTAGPLKTSTLGVIGAAYHAIPCALVEHVAVLLSEQHFLHFAGSPQRQRIQENNLVRHAQARNLTRKEFKDFFAFERLAMLAHDEQQRSFLPFRMSH